MIAGKNLWGDEITAGLSQRIVGEQRIEFYDEIPDNLYLALRNSAERTPEKIFLYNEKRHGYTFQWLLDDVDRLSDWLYHNMGVRMGDQVGLLLYNDYTFCTLVLALIRLGAVCVPLPTKYTQREVGSILKKVNVKLLFLQETFSSWFEGVDAPRVFIIPDDLTDEPFLWAGLPVCANADEVCFPKQTLDLPAVIIFTSGTTSRSKGAVLRNYNIMHAVAAYQKVLGIGAEDSTVIPIPLYYVTGLVALFGLFLYVGGTIYLQRFFHADSVLHTVQSEKITFLHASPTVYSLLYKQKDQFPSLPSLRQLACGSSNMPVQSLLNLHRWLPNISFRTIYGLTETSSPCTIFDGDAATDPSIGASGLAIPGMYIRIVGEDGLETAPGKPGEITVSGTTVIRNYYHMEPRALRNGWLSTGDIGYIDPKTNNLFVVDRIKDMINRGGEKVCSYDVENELHRIAGVRNAAVVGIPSEIYGEVPAAAVQLEPGCELDEKTIRSILRTRMAKYKIPEKVLFLPELPINRNFKVDKRMIRSLFDRKKEDTNR